MLISLLISALISTALAQTSCLSAGSQGPQLNGQCPGATDIPTNDGECCAPGSVQGAVLQADSATSAATSSPIGGISTGMPIASCVDMINPSTGKSDCPQRISLCEDSLYYSLMTQQCPKTCNRCSSSSTRYRDTNCVDLINPRRGVSDCPSLKSLCADSNYLEVMKTQCPRSCGFCGSTGTGITTSSTFRTMGCVDLINPRTGTSDCQSKKALCTDATYQSVMQKQCRATCGFC